jgi:hypothetical protein
MCLQKSQGNAAALAKWSFNATSLGRDVDMEVRPRHVCPGTRLTPAHICIGRGSRLPHLQGLTCGADGCASSIYIGDEYNFVYKLMLGTAAAAAAVRHAAHSV